MKFWEVIKDVEEIGDQLRWVLMVHEDDPTIYSQGFIDEVALALEALRKYTPQKKVGVNGNLCPNCYAKIRSGENFCFYCGQNVKEK